ncbi:hypothetical protein MML48_2g00000590 [Holotrichia oblita]|uniref:Uncharacterized protein n=1 Tax=Holotrichia oblita TaxID=644536 RepID=A0ACB9TII1_HOLOL|nr:hypothetical protein MML48_2g00000590 [Holotrichia oblita]
MKINEAMQKLTEMIINPLKMEITNLTLQNKVLSDEIKNFKNVINRQTTSNVTEREQRYGDTSSIKKSNKKTKTLNIQSPTDVPVQRTFTYKDALEKPAEENIDNRKECDNTKSLLNNDKDRITVNKVIPNIETDEWNRVPVKRNKRKQSNKKMSTYKRTIKSDRKLVFTAELMAEIRDKISNGQSKRSIARELNIPEATLQVPEAVEVPGAAGISMEVDETAKKTEVFEIEFNAITGLPVNPEYAEQIVTSILKDTNATETENLNNLIYLDIENNMKPAPSTTDDKENKRENIPVSYDINQTTRSKQVKALVIPEDLRPYPKCSQTEQTRKRRSQKSEILTSTPLKDELEAKQFELTKKVKRKIGSVKSEKPVAKAKQRKTRKESTSKINTNVKKRNGRQKASKPEECKGRKCNRRNIMTIL